MPWAAATLPLTTMYGMVEFELVSLNNAPTSDSSRSISGASLKVKRKALQASIKILLTISFEQTQFHRFNPNFFISQKLCREDKSYIKEINSLSYISCFLTIARLRLT